MRTDDFDEMKPQDTDGGMPDAVQVEADGFGDFDQDESSKSGKSLGDVFRDNPFIKIVLVGAGVVAVVIALFTFGGSSKKENVSEVGTAVNESVAPGQETSEAYRNAVEDINQQRLENAVQTGQSAIPIPTASPDASSVLPETDAPDIAIEDPLDGWRAQAQAPVQTGEPQPVLDPSAQALNPQPVQAAGPDPAAVGALSQAMAAQMQSILDKHGISGSQVMEVTAINQTGAGADASGAGSAASAGADVPVEEVEIIVPAGTIAYAQTLTEANSDTPGPVLARIASGPLAGSRILGSFEQSEEYLTLNFNTVVVKGISQSVNAVALDPKTTLPAVATEVDHRYWRRFILPAAARFIEGMGDAISQREQTDVTVNGDTVTSSKPDLKPREELAAGLSEGTSEIGDQLTDIADETKVLVKVHAGTPIGILFLEPVTREK
jgi:intracellular multiplication protein IcmE